jgi:hypothetical protein
VYAKHQEAFGGSTQIFTLLDGYNRTIYGDWLNSDPQTFSALTSHIVKVSILSLLINFLMNSGMIAAISKQESTVSSLFRNIVRYSPGYGILTIGFIANFGLLSFLIIFLNQYIFSDGFDAFRTELPIFYGGIFSLVITLMLGSFLWICSVRAKVNFTSYNLAISLSEAIKWAGTHKAKLIKLSIIMITFGIITILILKYLIIYKTAKSYFTLFLFCLFSILILLIKIIFRIWLIIQIKKD